MTDNHEVFNPDNLTIEPVFKNYKEKQKGDEGEPIEKRLKDIFSSVQSLSRIRLFVTP